MEKQTVPTPPPPQQPAIPQKPKLSSLLIGLAALVLILLASTGYLAFQNYQLRKEISQLQTSPSPTPTPDPTANWKTYKISEVGLEFKLPLELTSLGELNQVKSQGEKGNEICLFFSTLEGARCSTSPFGIILQSKDFLAGREAVFFDNLGYSGTEPKYYLKYWSDSGVILGEIPSGLAREILNLNGVKILKITGKSEEIDRAGEKVMSPVRGTPGEKNVGAIVNTQNPTYPSITVQMELKDKLTGELFDQILSTFRFLGQGGSCKNDYFGISLDLPNSNWSCESKGPWINLKSDIFTITISDLGRGPYCGDGPDPEHLCKTRQFVIGDKFTFTVFNYQGEDKEIFGGLGTFDGKSPWISIKYTNMETQPLTSGQKSELLQLLNSIKTIQ